MLVSLERIYSSPPRVQIDAEETGVQFRKLLRDRTGGLWAIGDCQVLFSRNGLDWINYSLNLKSDGAFSVYSVTMSGLVVFSFVQNRNGLCVYRLSDERQRWILVSQLQLSSSFVVSATGKDSLVLVTEEPSSTVLYRSTDQAESWNKTSLGLHGTPVYLHFSNSHKGFCCLWHSFEGGNLSPRDRSSLYSTSNLGITWKCVANLNTMVLDSAAIDDERVLIAGSNGFLAICDGEGCWRFNNKERDDVVAVDSFADVLLAVTESGRTPIRHTFMISNNRKDWVEVPIRLPGRVDGVKLIAQGKVIVCATRELYLGTLSSNSE